MEIKDKKGCYNVIVDHLSRVVTTTEIEEETEVAENFLDEQLFQLSFQSPWYADIVNFLACGVMPPEFSYQKREKLRIDCKTRENFNFRKKGKIVISFKILNFSRSQMTKRTSPLESSPEI